MISKVLLMGLVILTMTGCNPKCEPNTVYVDRVVEVKVPVKCTVPKVECEFSGVGSEPVAKLLECVVVQKRAMEVCN